MATFTLQNIPADAQTVKVQYKTTDESQWHNAEVNSERTAAIARPEFTSHTSADWTTLEAANVKPYKRKVAGTGILDGKTYQYKLIVDSFESEVAEFDSALQSDESRNSDAGSERIILLYHREQHGCNLVG